MILGIDVSTYLEQKRILNPKFFHNGKEIDPLQEFRNNGVTYLRTRVWNDPHDDNGKPYLGGTCDLDNYIALAKIGKKYGYKLLIDFHYSDFWADPLKQTCPKAWKGLSFEQIEKNVYQFTKDCLTKIKNEGLDTDLIQIGNEITNGMVWPYAELNAKRDNFEPLTKLLKAGIEAAKEVYPNIKIIIHLEKSNLKDIYFEYFSNLEKYNVEFDIIGMSYYPYWHGSFDELFANVKMCQETFKKEVMIMETSYAFTLEDYIPGVDNHMAINKTTTEYTSHLPEEISPEGQARFFRRFLKLAREHNIAGVFYWEPMWLPGKGMDWATVEGQKYFNQTIKNARNEWSNQCLFDYQGNALPSFDEYVNK